MNRLVLLLFVLFAVGGAAAALGTTDWAEPPVVQPLQFNHARHAERDITCDVCHEGLQAGSAHAWLPRTSLCMDCHGEDTTTTPDKDVLKSFASEGREVPWVRLYRLPAHVVFSHERHVGLGGLQCEACHGDHGKSAAPPPHPEKTVLRMDGCIACHTEKGASTDCIACHR